MIKLNLLASHLRKELEIIKTKVIMKMGLTTRDLTSRTGVKVLNEPCKDAFKVMTKIHRQLLQFRQLMRL